jgi:polyhydroxybutyrate depolymerase
VTRVLRPVRISDCMTLIPFCLLLVACGGSSQSTSSLPTAHGSCNFQASGNCVLIVNGVTRTYLLHLPGNFQPNTSGVVIAFHGARGSGSQFEGNTGLSKKADQVGFAVVYPDGLPNPSGATSWNGYFNPTFGTNPPDDSGFIRQLILTLEANLHPDPKKIYVTGLSAGGYMAHRAAIDNSDLVAAAGVVEGSLSVQTAGGTQKPPSAKSPVAVLILHGDADTVIHYCGLTNSHVTVASQDQTFNYWFQIPANACSTLNTTASLCTGFSGSPTTVTLKDATGCNSGTEVRIYRLMGATHTWYHVAMNVPPGSATQPYNPNLNSTTGIVTNDILWNFFASHAKP